MRSIEAISHVTVATDDLRTVSADYEGLLGTQPSVLDDDAGRPIHRFETGNVALLLRATGDGEAPGLCGLTFRVGDLARACEELDRCSVSAMAPSAHTSEQLPSEQLLDPVATHGLPLALTAAMRPVASAAATVTLDHVVIRTPNPERAVALYGGRLGLDMRLDRTNPAWDARLMFFRCGDLVVEVAHVLSKGLADGPDTFGGLSWRVPDIDALHARLTADRFALSPVRVGRRPGSRVCTVRDRTGGVPTILLGVTSQGKSTLAH